MLSNLNHVLAGWTKFPVKSFPNGISYTRAVLFGQYLVVVAHEKISSKKVSADSKDRPQATLLAIDLQYSLVQEAQIDKDIFSYHDEYTLTKYDENQMIKFGGSYHNNITGTMVRITIKSFQPFLVDYEEIESQSRAPKIRLHTAQIYKDSLLVFGGRSDKYFTGPENTTWSFNLKSYEWKKYDFNEEKPRNVKEFSDGKKLYHSEEPGPRDRPSSFIVGDEFYIYGGEGVKGRDHSDLNDIFVLGLNTMTWKKLEQHETFVKKDNFPDENQLNGDLYRDNLILLGGELCYDDTLFCWNYRSNSWSTFKTESLDLVEKSNLIVYDNLLLVLGQDQKELSLATLNLENLNLPDPKQTGNEYRYSLFMSEEKSDVIIKIGDQTIPTHKNILMENSRFFAGLFEINMSEAREGVIKVQDCDYIVFREFLKFIYCEKVDFYEDVEFTLKLLKLSDKYGQENLASCCMNYLKHQICSDNFFTILNYARENNLSDLQEECRNRFSINSNNFVKLINHMDQEDRLEFVEGNLEFRDKAFDWIIKNFKWQENNIKFYEDFLIENINMEKIEDLVLFLEGCRHWRVSSESELKTANLRDAVYDFLWRNFEDPEINIITENRSSRFLFDLLSFVRNSQRENEAQVKKEENELIMEGEENGGESQPGKEAKRIHKRKEPGKGNTPEEKPELKKTKKSSIKKKI